MGKAGARQFVENAEPVGFQPGILALPERRRGRERQQVRQEIGDLVQQVDAKLVVVDADMHVHAANHQAADHGLQVLGDNGVALLLGVGLFLPAGKRVRRGGDGRQAVFIGDLGDNGPDRRQVFVDFGDVGRDLGVDFDLRPQEFMRDNALDAFLAVLEQCFRRVAGDVPGLLVDEQVFLLDADGETGAGGRHVNTPGLREARPISGFPPSRRPGFRPSAGSLRGREAGPG